MRASQVSFSFYCLLKGSCSSAANGAGQRVLRAGPCEDRILQERALTDLKVLIFSILVLVLL